MYRKKNVVNKQKNTKKAIEKPLENVKKKNNKKDDTLSFGRKKSVKVEKKKSPVKQKKTSVKQKKTTCKVNKKKKKITSEAIDSYLQIPEKEFREMHPSDVKDMMNEFAIYIQENGDNDIIFNRILVYMHKFVNNMAFRQFIIPGMEGKDIYQEACIALRQRAIEKFNPDKKMSFVNFAKMCMRRYIITLLNTSKNRRRDQPLNRSVPIDQAFPSEDENEENGSLMNLISDDYDFIQDMCISEDIRLTKEILGNILSPLEFDVFSMHLEKRSYRDIAKSVSKKYDKKYNEKSVDNALIRVRAKASALLGKNDTSIPLFDETE